MSGNRRGNGCGSQVDEASVPAIVGTLSGVSRSRGLRSREALKGGAASVAGAARLAIAAAEDMVNGDLTSQEATVLNTTAGRVLKAAELFLKYAKEDTQDLALPAG